MGHGRCPGEDITDKGISIIIHTYLIDTCTGIFHGLHCHCNWWARFVISYLDTCPIDKEQQQHQLLSTTRSRSTFTILSLTTNPLKLHLSQTTFYQLRRKKKPRTIPTGCVVTINEATQTYTYLTHQQLPNHHPPQCPGHPPPLPTLPQAASSPPKNPP